MKAKLICPLLTIASANDGLPATCQEDGCEWWIKNGVGYLENKENVDKPEIGCCAIKLIARK